MHPGIDYNNQGHQVFPTDVCDLQETFLSFNDQRKTFWEIFSTFNFFIVLLGAQANCKIESDIKFSERLPWRVY